MKEGDTLFKIDDEAYQLQLASANAAYESAQAGITAQNSGARDLQNYQTERQIQLLKDSLGDTQNDIDELQDNIGDIRDAKAKLSKGKQQAQAGLDAANKAYYDAQNTLNPQIDAAQSELATLEEKIKAKQTELDAAADEVMKEQLAKELEALKSSRDAVQGKKSELEKGLSEAKTARDQLQTQVNMFQSQMDSLDATKTQLKSGVDQLESGQDTIRDNLTTAEQAYSITQNEVYPQTDAVSAAQLQQASVGIDSAQMQVDFCTVKAPISGVVESVSVEKNGMAAAGNVAYIISNKESMKITFQVTEQAKNTLAVGDHITVERGGQAWEGSITQIGTMAGQQTKLFAVEATVTGAGDSLPNGVSVKVHATTRKESGKLIVPYDAIYFSAGDAYVYCVEDNKAVKTPVTVGLMSDTQAVIEEGLTEDSLIVDNWSSKIRNGAEVEIVSANGEKITDVPEEDSGEEGTEEAE